MAPTTTPHMRLQKALTERQGGALPGEIPTKWEKFSDVVILPQNAFSEEEWNSDETLWKIVAESLGTKRVARMGEVHGEYRKSGVELLLGDDDWVVRRENGIDYGYRMTKCMFSAGNVNERRRMGEVVGEGEVVVDMYAGIGYYTLPALVHGRASIVHACEWNPEAVMSLGWGLEANRVEERCVVHVGDNAVTTRSLNGLADRVILGLLPSSDEGLGSALEVLRPEGGVLHVHGLAEPNSYDKWEEETRAAVTAERIGCDIRSSMTRVKSYAPHWDHVVLDLIVA